MHAACGAVAFGVIAFSSGGGGASAPLWSPLVRASNCPLFVVIGSRGSGSRPGASDWGGGLGLPGQRFAQTFASLVGARNVRVEYNRYEAVGILPTLKQILLALSIGPAGAVAEVEAIRNALNGLGALARIKPIGAYHGSVIDGEKLLRQKVGEEISSCSSAGTRLLLVGYSQGAQVTGDVYAALGASDRRDVLGVALFGDPRYNRKSFADLARLDHNGVLGARAEYPADSRKHVLSYCHPRDPICQGLTQLIHGTGAHNNYPPLAPDAAARYFAKLAAETSGTNPPPASPNEWPTKRNDGSPAFFEYLGASFIDPAWSSCDANYCIAGSGDTVYVFSLENGIDQIGSVPIDTPDPRAALTNLSIPEGDINQLLKP
jgi:hypothetical protein